MSSRIGVETRRSESAIGARVVLCAPLGATGSTHSARPTHTAKVLREKTKRKQNCKRKSWDDFCNLSKVCVSAINHSAGSLSKRVEREWKKTGKGTARKNVKNHRHLGAVCAFIVSGIFFTYLFTILVFSASPVAKQTKTEQKFVRLSAAACDKHCGVIEFLRTTFNEEILFFSFSSARSDGAQEGEAAPCITRIRFRQ